MIHCVGRGCDGMWCAIIVAEEDLVTVILRHFIALNWPPFLLTVPVAFGYFGAHRNAH